MKNTDLIWVDPELDFSDSKTLFKRKTRGKVPKIDKPSPEKSFTVAELAAEWNLSTHKIRELFRNEPGVLKMQDKDFKKKRKRRYTTLRIPLEVAQRVRSRMT
jgi:hypothetical protein